MAKTSLITNAFLKLEDSMSRFFISSIGPKTKKPIIELMVNWPKKAFATNASEVEQTENIKAASIITISANTLLSESVESISLDINT